MTAIGIYVLTLGAALSAAPTPTPYQTVWEIDLLPGTFHVRCEKLPHYFASRSETNYLTVAFHTPDNYQFVLAYGLQRTRTPVLKEFLQVSATPENTKVAEVRKVNGAKEQVQRVIAKNADGFTFTLKEKTRVFFAAEGSSWQKVGRGDAKGIQLLPDWGPWRPGVELQSRKLPFRVEWRPEREVYQMAIECFDGTIDFQDWLITVDYLE